MPKGARYICGARIDLRLLKDIVAVLRIKIPKILHAFSGTHIKRQSINRRGLSIGTFLLPIAFSEFLSINE